MSKQKVLSNKQRPVRLPIVGTAFWLVVLDQYNAPGWAWGIVITILAFGWLAVIISLVNSEQVEIRELM